MRYIMKQKLFTWGDNFVIKDEFDREAFLVKGKVFSIGDQLSFLDMAGNELAFIRQKLLSWEPTFEIYRDGSLYAIVHKQLFTFFSNKFTIEVAGASSLEVEGDFTNHEYLFAQDDETVATVSKAWFTWAETYGVDVVDEEDALLILPCTVVIEQVCRERNSPVNIDLGL